MHKPAFCEFCHTKSATEFALIENQWHFICSCSNDLASFTINIYDFQNSAPSIEEHFIHIDHQENDIGSADFITMMQRYRKIRGHNDW